MIRLQVRGDSAVHRTDVCHWGVLQAAILLVGIFNLPAFGQSNGQPPHLAYLYPAGCERGMTCEVIVGGQFLRDVREVFVSGKGVGVEIVSWYRPLTAGQYNDLQTKLSETRERLIGQSVLQGSTQPSEAEIAAAAGISDEELREMQIYRQRDRDPKRQPNEQLEEQVTLRITVALEAELGKRELRFLRDDAISNPIWLHLDRWIETRESEPNDVVAAVVEGRWPIVINGQIMPGDVDRFQIHASKGMNLVVQASARDVIPYLADAVPGWFQAVIRIIDEGGDEVSFADSFYYRQDPMLHFEVPRDGDYTIEIRDSLYRGREDFVYRMMIGEMPVVTSIFPMGARVESETAVQLRGWNLKHSTQNIRTMDRSQYRPLQWFASLQGDQSVRFPFQIDHWPESFDAGSNDDRSTAQEISTRMTINGRIETPGDKDVYVINGTGRFVAEIYARRLGSPLDSMLSLCDEHGREVESSDDFVDASQSMLTHHSDSHLTASIPAKGKFYLTVSDAQGNGGADFGYRLHVHPPQADFELRVVPSTIIARAGQIVPITVFALRKDGFDQDIELSLVDPPSGFQLDGGLIPGDLDQIKLTLTVPRQSSAEPYSLKMEGAAPRRMRSRSMIVRPAVPAENMMQAFIWHHLVPVEQWNVVASGRPVSPLPLQVNLPAYWITLPRQGEFRMSVVANAKNIPMDQFHLETVASPKGISASLVTDSNGSIAIVLKVSSTELKPGMRGNLLLSLYKEYTPEPTESDPAPSPRRTDYGLLPAIPFEISAQRAVR